MSSKAVSLKAIAQQLNVSINTVSHALRDKDDISEELKIKIRRKAIELGYMPNHVAQNMKKDEKPLVGIIVGSFMNLFFNIFSNELTRLFQAKNEYDFLFLYSGHFDINVLKQCVLLRVDLVVTHNEPDKSAYEFALLNNIKIVFVGGAHVSDMVDTVDRVIIDHKMGCSLAARYLRNCCNSRKFVYVGPKYYLSDYRYKLFSNEINALDEGCEVICFTEEEDIRVLYGYISGGYRNLFFYNDTIAYEVLARLDTVIVDIRRSFPDLNIIGFDGLCEYVSGLQQISTIKINFPEFALSTYEVIHARLEFPKKPVQQLVLPVTLHKMSEN